MERLSAYAMNARTILASLGGSSYGGRSGGCSAVQFTVRHWQRGKDLGSTGQVQPSPGILVISHVVHRRALVEHSPGCSSHTLYAAFVHPAFRCAV